MLDFSDPCIYFLQVTYNGLKYFHSLLFLIMEMSAKNVRYWLGYKLDENYK